MSQKLKSYWSWQSLKSWHGCTNLVVVFTEIYTSCVNLKSPPQKMFANLIPYNVFTASFMNWCECFWRKCSERQIWSCISTRCYLPWTCRSAFCIQSAHQRSKYSFYPAQAEVGKNKTSWSAKLDTFIISFAHTDHLFSFSKGSWRGHHPSWLWPKHWEQLQTGLPSPRLWFAPVCLSRWNQCTRSRKSLQPGVWQLLRVVMTFYWEIIVW